MNRNNLEQLFDDLFEIGNDLGSGGLALIFQSTAIKKINASTIYTNIKKGDKFAIKVSKEDSPNANKRILNEIKTFEAIGKNEHIITYYGWLKRSDVQIILLENAKTDLYNLVKNLKRKRETLAEGVKDTILERVCLGLKAVYTVTGSEGQKYYHRDVSPSNIFIFGTDFEGIAKLGDFGSAGVARPTSESEKPHYGDYSVSTFTLHGKLYYAAPELFSQPNEINKRLIYNLQTEIYSLGLVGWFLECGEIPFDSIIPAKYEKIKQAKENKNGFLDKQVKEMLVPIGTSSQKIKTIRKSIDPNPNKRQRSIDQFLDEYQKGESSNVLENLYHDIEGILNKPKSGLCDTMEIHNVDAVIQKYEKMVAYEKNHSTQNTLTEKARKKIEYAARDDYKILENKTDIMCDNIDEGEKPFKDQAEKDKFIDDIITKMLVWGNDFGVKFTDSNYGRFSLGDPGIEKIVNKYR